MVPLNPAHCKASHVNNLRANCLTTSVDEQVDTMICVKIPHENIDKTVNLVQSYALFGFIGYNEIWEPGRVRVSPERGYEL